MTTANDVATLAEPYALGTPVASYSQHGAVVRIVPVAGRVSIIGAGGFQPVRHDVEIVWDDGSLQTIPDAIVADYVADAARLAQYDSLTGLANRHRMDKRLRATLTAYQVAGRSCALLMMDLDRFKAVNDTLGHPAGDELLRQVAGRLQRIVTESGCEIGRLGGDEFQIMIPDLDDRGRLGEIARTIITMISQPYQIEGSRCVIGASVGMGSCT